MLTLKIHDIAFAHAKSAGSDMCWPEKLRWTRVGPDTDVTFFTECCLNDSNRHVVANSRAAKKIAWMIEPHVVRPEPYGWIRSNHHLFTAVLTHNKTLIAEMGPKFKYVPLGGCWVPENHRQWQDKTGKFCIIASEKNWCPGHYLRHEVIKKYASKYGIGVFGGGYHHVQYKHEVHLKYKYSIVIENCIEKGWFTEKLLDSITCWSMPIYWGDPDVKDIFDKDGITYFSDLDDLERVLANPPEPTSEGLTNNVIISRKYLFPEDYIFDNILPTL